MELKVRLIDINPHITCSICHGYLIDATTVTECLHTFCKSCLVKHLEENNNCPACNIVIHQSHPLQYISYDRTLQDVVYKLVPDLQEREIELEKRFYRERSLPWPKENMEKALRNNQNMLNGENLENWNFHRDDEQVGIELVSGQEDLKQIKSRFIRCSTSVTIGHVKKFLAYRLMKSAEKHREIDVFLNGEMLGKDHNLKFVLVTRWRIKGRGPLRLYYKKIQPQPEPQ